MPSNPLPLAERIAKRVKKWRRDAREMQKTIKRCEYLDHTERVRASAIIKAYREKADEITTELAREGEEGT